jgi:hypothetical protein
VLASSCVILFYSLLFLFNDRFFFIRRFFFILFVFQSPGPQICSLSFLFVLRETALCESICVMGNAHFLFHCSVAHEACFDCNDNNLTGLQS